MSADNPRGKRPRYPPAPSGGRRAPRAPGAGDPRAGGGDAPRYAQRGGGPARGYDYGGGGDTTTLLPRRGEPGGGGRRRSRWRVRLTPRRVLLGLATLIAGWLVLSLALFLISSHFERISPPANVASALDSAGPMPFSTNNILVLGSDRREKGSKEPGANTSGPSRSDTIMLIRTGGGHSARLSVPRDTVIDIPGHGLQKINAAYAYGGPRFAIETIKRFLGVPINHVVEVNFEDFPALVDSMGGVTYTGGCIHSLISGGNRNGGITLWLSAGTHHLDGREALAVARTRHNLCAPTQDDINREEHQQRLFEAMKSQLLSPLSFLRLPLIAWNAPPAIISDMSGPELLGLFSSLAIEGSAPTKILMPTGLITLPDGEEGLTISEAAKRQDVAEFMKR